MPCKTQTPAANESIMLRLLEDGGPLCGHSFIIALRQSMYWPLLMNELVMLDRGALYRSHCHGEGHAERVILLGALLSLENNLTEDESRMLLSVCSYHDVGRQHDWEDDFHGHRSAMRLGSLVSADESSLRMMRAMMEAHSLADHEMDNTIIRHDPPDHGKCRQLARIFKDCDGLDRVRIGSLDLRYLRCRGSKKYASFALELYEAYNACEWARQR